jgi:hypothetical protein
LIGISIIDFWWSFRSFEKEGIKLTPDDLTNGYVNRLLPFWLSEVVLKRKIEGSTFVYVQDRVVLPSEKAIEMISQTCIDVG